MEFLIIVLVAAVVAVLILKWSRDKSKRILQQTYDSLEGLSRDELRPIIDDLVCCLALSGLNPDERIPLEKRKKYGCVTRKEATQLYDAAVEHSNALLQAERQHKRKQQEKPIYTPPKDVQPTKQKGRSKEFQESRQAVAKMSLEQLNQMHEALLEYVEQLPLSLLPGLNDEQQARLRKEYAAFCQKPLPDGMVYGCRTYGEVKELNELAVKYLDEMEN